MKQQPTMTAPSRGCVLSVPPSEQYPDGIKYTRDSRPAKEADTMTRTLHVYIGAGPDRSDLQDSLAALDAGEEVEREPSRLIIESLETFGRIFRATNLELIEAIAEHEPESIRELARIVDRHPPEVTDNVTELADYGVITLEEHGRAKQPRLWYDEIEISGDIPLRTDDGSSDVGAAP